MASIRGFSCFNHLGLSYSCSFSRNMFLVSPICQNLDFNTTCSRISIKTLKPKTPNQEKLKSVELDRFVTSDEEDEEDEISEGYFEAIEELERMTREPADILEEMTSRLSARELQLVLIYFSQEGRDSWCALEVFEWLKKENKVDKETMELMVSIMCSWAKKVIENKGEVWEVVDLLVDMDCVGLKPSFSMIEKVISLYWELNEKDKGILFVKEVLRREIGYEDGDRAKTGGPVGYLAWKMMEDGNYKDALKLVIHFRELGLKPDVYSYIIAMRAVVDELNSLTKALRKLSSFTKANSMADLDIEDTKLVEEYKSNILNDGVCLANWVLEEGDPSLFGMVHERLLAMYICAGHGLEAERQLWEMKLVGKKADEDFYDIVLAICASQKEEQATARLLARMEFTGLLRKKKTLTWLLRGYLKGSHYTDAAETVIKMLDLGLWPEYVYREAVMRGLIQQPGNLKMYLKLCKSLSDAGLIVNCLTYLYIKKHKMWIIQMV